MVWRRARGAVEPPAWPVGTSAKCGRQAVTAAQHTRLEKVSKAHLPAVTKLKPWVLIWAPPGSRLSIWQSSDELVALSANFALYGNLSDRMMSLAAGLGPKQEIYSIDESFIDLTTHQVQEANIFLAGGAAIKNTGTI